MISMASWSVASRRTVTGGWLTALGAEAATARLAAGSGDPGFHRDRLTTARHYAATILPTCGGLAAAVRGCGDTCLRFAES